MGKALVIKGANFYANRVDTVEFDESVPCTGVELSQSTIAFTALNATVQLTATKTPADTTDALTWISSNTNIATVVDGLVTCVGVGSATITVTCGTQSDTCAVTATHSINVASSLGYDKNHMFSGTSLPTKDHLSRWANDYAIMFGDSNATPSNIKAFSDASEPVLYPILMPKNTNTITITGLTGIEKGGLRYEDSTSYSSYMSSSANKGAMVKAITNMLNVSAGELTFTLPDVSGIDSFVLQLNYANIVTSETVISSDINISFTHVTS